jgi:hypothetical protein
MPEYFATATGRKVTVSASAMMPSTGIAAASAWRWIVEPHGATIGVTNTRRLR